MFINRYTRVLTLLTLIHQVVPAQVHARPMTYAYGTADFNSSAAMIQLVMPPVHKVVADELVHVLTLRSVRL